ncbi:PREDICTED: protein TWIN LOV 1 isoform X2 [Nicotiana attenuata]|uniref:protein TWIN LOV 1 isoform X2 n=1 Tax=Nicotiana attenuata TaxID=49451 RepID=UPI000905316A|nr:PREDICTED: protein TWIN LOV 1 isoform X2 [Nicotiana attenuata]
MESQLGLIEQSFNVRYSDGVKEALDELPDSFTITDPSICGHPIVYASRGFLKMFGYNKNEVIGRNGRVFQGPKTNRRAVMEIREAIREERAIEISLLNYRKDGTPFWMLFHMCPVYSEKDGRVVHFLGVQVPILRRRKSSGGGIGKNGVCNDGGGNNCRESAFRCCRREVCSNLVMEMDRALSLDSVSGLDCTEVDVEGPCEASDQEKRKASFAVNNIISVLANYSELTSRLVGDKRCCQSGTSPLSASLNISFGRIKQSFVLTDAHLPDMPIVYASDAFLRLTGFSRHEVLGRNCRFLSGEDTDRSTQFQAQSLGGCIFAFRKDGTSFWNFLHISPVRNASGKVAYFVGIQIEDTSEARGKQGLNPEMRQRSVVAAVKVAVRGLSMGASTS